MPKTTSTNLSSEYPSQKAWQLYQSNLWPLQIHNRSKEDDPFPDETLPEFWCQKNTMLQKTLLCPSLTNYAQKHHYYFAHHLQNMHKNIIIIFLTLARRHSPSFVCEYFLTVNQKHHFIITTTTILQHYLAHFLFHNILLHKTNK